MGPDAPVQYMVQFDRLIELISLDADQALTVIPVTRERLAKGGVLTGEPTIGAYLDAADL
jgi:hypothetical protein